MSRRLGIDLSADTVMMADVSQSPRGVPRIHGFARLEAVGDLAELAADVRRARKRHRFPRNCEAVAWSGDSRLQALRDAGLTVEHVIHPGEALARVERMHRPGPGANTTAVLALHPASGALAIVRDQKVLHETPLTWTASAAAAATHQDLLRRYAFLSELTELLHGSFDAARRSQGVGVNEILTCGSLPELRSFTMPLADEFDVEVEALDSLSGFEIRVKSDSFERLRESMAALRVAIAAGRRWHAPRHSAARRLARVAVPAGVAAGAMYAIAIYGLGQPPPRTSGRQPSPQNQAPAAPATPVPVVTNQQPPPAASRQVTLAASPASQVAVAALVAQVAVPAPASQVAIPALAAQDPSPALAPRDAAPALASQDAVLAGASRNASPAPQPREVAVPARREPAERVFAASFAVTSILWSAERQLALVDGTIVSVGDVVAGARVVEIRPDAVIARDRVGRLRRAVLGRPAVPAVP